MDGRYVVEGYEFDTLEEANEAKKELEAVLYMSQRTEGCSPKETYLIYNKLVKGNVFHTVIGQDYLRKLETYLVENGLLGAAQENTEFYEDVDGIAGAVESAKVYEKSEADGTVNAGNATENAVNSPVDNAESSPVNNAQNNAQNNAAGEENTSGAQEIKIPDMIAKKDIVYTEADMKRVEKKLKRAKDKLATSICFNVVLAIGIVVMIYIASTSSNVNILNYETALQDKYSSWAEDLKQKEEQLKEREKAVEELEKGQN